MTCNCSSQIGNTEQPHGGVKLIPFYQSEHSPLIAELKAEQQSLAQMEEDQFSKFLLNDESEVGYGASAVISSAADNNKKQSSRIYAIKRGDSFLTFLVTAEILQQSQVAMRLTLEVFKPLQRKWSIDIDIATGQVVGGMSSDENVFGGGVEILGWSSCVWKCLKKKAPQCLYCVTDPDCWTLCAGGTVAICVWDCSW